MKDLIKGIHRFQTEYYCTHQDLYQELARGQHPKVLFITCSDSRIDPSLLCQAEPGEIFEIQNAGNIIPPYESTNGGEGATIEYAIDALGIRQIVICGHTHCGAMKGLLNLHKIEEELPLVHGWLKHAEATRRVLKEHYTHLSGEDLLDAAVSENVLTQIENLRTYPTIRSKLYNNELKIYAWTYDIDTGEVMAYDPATHSYVPPYKLLPPDEQDLELSQTFAGCVLPNRDPKHLISPNASKTASSLLESPPGTEAMPAVASSKKQGSASRQAPGQPNGRSHVDSVPAQPNERFPFMYMPPDQADRIYRGSKPRSSR
ncbi:MAG: carbonic anhydrase [Kaiparowitsia implicata GSE-PSE-MK54-09C]|jgi:carbonic anhydrase|nr:carbonic anhydrase [Kaiparowitsia implicata GSE-PSE-MK54-09C]